MFQVKDPQRTLRAITRFRYGLGALFLLLASLREEKTLLAFLMARTGYCPLVRR
ncbi:hypothetical protein [Thermus amyloliquefaciens]|uniref:hypothetical protein n=1 Tax=Thermus amyloliquefaciens TaxID=1449080 RepID=UPI000A7EDBED|nr:hypothetical protein [Thermus amyloliquefaciens]